MRIGKPSLADTPSLRRLWKEAFGDTDALLDAFWKTAFSPERCRCVIADGEVAAALYWFDCLCRGKRIAYLYAVATGKAYRGRGLCHRLMEDTHRHLREEGYEGAVLVPGSEGLFAFYRRMGYQTATRMGELSCLAHAGAVSLRPIDKEEYARERRRLLPEGGVIEENESLHFLDTYARFYAGEGFLLAARTEGDLLDGIELLGNAEAAPALTHALGCVRGHFRVPHGDTPFAMYRPLGESILPPPSYFGLAFD